MKFLLTIEAHGKTPEAAIGYVKRILDDSARHGKPIGFAMGDSQGSAGSTWRVLTCTDEGDDTTELRRVTPEWLSQAMNEGDGAYRP